MPESLQQALQNLSTAITSAGAVEDFLYAGGPVLLVIFALTLALWFLIAQRFWFFAVQSKPYNLQTLGQWRSLPEHQSWSAHATRDMLLSQARVQYNGALGTIRTLINIAPLLGLLGTVSGMIEVFDVIAFSGSSNVQAMAAGISTCILSTMAGLVVAISGLYFIAVLQRCSDHAIG
ncbi:MAG: MotA/TolQ/ExbB proton channel family protein, partial [Pseudomonadales bacterium]|nr:MotA/TolQ/ExbB proton channel family protein [Pseudomonadales bacterium]